MFFRIVVLLSLGVLTTYADNVAAGNVDVSLQFLSSVGDLLGTADRIRISDSFPAQIETEQGRSKKGLRMAIPLIIGFKVASVITSGLVALKVLVTKTVLASSLALIVSLVLSLRYVYDKLNKMHQTTNFEPTKFHYPQQQYSWEPVYDTTGGHEDLQTQYSNQLNQISAIDTNNGSSFTSSNAANENRKSYYSSPPVHYKTLVYKTTVKHVKKR